MTTYCAPCLADLALVREAVTAVLGTASCMAHAVLLSHPTDTPQRRLTRLGELRTLAEGKLLTASAEDAPAIELLVQEFALAGAMDMSVPLRELAGDRTPRPPKARRERGGRGERGPRPEGERGPRPERGERGPRNSDAPLSDVPASDAGPSEAPAQDAAPASSPQPEASASQIAPQSAPESAAPAEPRVTEGSAPESSQSATTPPAAPAAPAPEAAAPSAPAPSAPAPEVPAAQPAPESTPTSNGEPAS